VVISYAAWRDAFGFDPNIVGKTIKAEVGQAIVLGVTAKEFEFPENPGFWYLMRLAPAYDNVRAYRGLVRVRPGRSRERLQAELSRLSQELGPDSVTHQSPRLVADSMLTYIVGSLRGTVLILFGATVVLLAIASINVASLLLSRASVLAREMALRDAMGAGRWRLMRHLLIDSLVSTALGAALGLVLAVVGVRLLMAIAPPELPRLGSVPVDWHVLLFAGGLGLSLGLLVGLVPAVRLLRNPLHPLINDAGRGTTDGPAQPWILSGLVVTEIALAVLLVIGAGLLVRSYRNLTATDPGFRPDRLLTATLNVSGHTAVTYVTDSQGGRQIRAYDPMATFFREFEGRIKALPGVESVASTTILPLGNVVSTAGTRFALPDRGEGITQEAPFAAMDGAVSPEFFDAMKVRFLAGRGFNADDRPYGGGVAVVNETFARRFFAGENPIGKRIHFPENRWVPGDTGYQFSHRTIDDLEIIGVVGDVRFVGLAQPAEPAIYLSSEQWIWRRRSLVVRTVSPNPATLIAAIRSTLASMDPNVGAEFETYDAIMRRATARERLGMTLLSLFGFTALVLAAVGVYGLMAYSVAQRLGEIAVRAALGATSGSILRLFMLRGIVLSTTGVVLGTVTALALRHVVASELYGMSGPELGAFGLVPGVLLLIAGLACFIPALRATRVDPARLLRSV
jgi:predicted permease